MGILRLLFALAVVVVHTSPLFSFQSIAVFAVNSFFMISGFYMALIIKGKYTGKNNSYFLFLTNRVFRIFPVYWTILFFTFFFTIIKFFLFPNGSNYLTFFIHGLSTEPFPALTVISAIMRNILLVQPFDYLQQNYLNPGYLIIQPAWSLQLELVFYLLAPFLVRTNRIIISIFVLFFTYLTFFSGIEVLESDLSIAYLFLSRFVFFLYGILAYHLYKRYSHYPPRPYLLSIFFCALILFIFAFSQFASSSNAQLMPNSPLALIYYITLLCGIGISFLLTNKVKFDSFIGALSYPAYLSHQLIYKLLMISPISQMSQTQSTLITIIVTLIVSYLLVTVVESPINKIRQARLK